MLAGESLDVAPQFFAGVFMGHTLGGVYGDAINDAGVHASQLVVLTGAGGLNSLIDGDTLLCRCHNQSTVTKMIRQLSEANLIFRSTSLSNSGHRKKKTRRNTRNKTPQLF